MISLCEERYDRKRNDGDEVMKEECKGGKY